MWLISSTSLDFIEPGHEAACPLDFRQGKSKTCSVVISGIGKRKRGIKAANNKSADQPAQTHS